MRFTAIAIAIITAVTLEAQITIPRLTRKVETSAPQSIELQLRRGETVDLGIQFTSYAAVMDLTGATVTLHAVTNGMAEGTSFQISGTASSNGTVAVRIVTDEWLPSTMTSGTWTMEVIQPTQSRIMRASGTVRVSGLVYPSAASPLPISWSSNLWAAIYGLQAKTSNWDTALSTASANATNAVSTHNTNETSHASLFATANTPRKLYSPTSTNTWIGGDGNQYVISNFWNMTFSDDFDDSYYPSQTNYLFTSASQSFFEGISYTVFLGNTNWTAYYSISLSGIAHKTSSLAAIRTWAATTNTLVLDPAAGTGASGYAYVTYWATTNLVDSLSYKPNYSGATNIADSAVAVHNTNETSHAELLAEKVGIAHTNDPSAHPSLFSLKADSSHTNDPAAHAALFAGKADTNDLRIVGAVQRTGDTMTGSLLTTVNHTTTAPAGNEFPTAAWVRSLAMSGAEWYFSPTATNGFGEKTANFVALSATPSANAFTNIIASPVTSTTYLAGGVTTNFYTALRSPITLDAYMARAGGTTASIVPVHPEIYYIYNGTTNHLGDWSVPDQTITATTPTRYEWVVPFVEPSITGSVRVIAYMKSGAVSGPAAGLHIYGGNGYSSHLDIQNIVTASGGLTGSQVTNIVRSITYTNQTWAAAGTNATYQLSWDVTNMTFKVLEILP